MPRPRTDGRIDWHELAGDEPAEQMPDRSEPLLDARCGKLARTGLDPASDVHRLDSSDRRHAGGRAPRQKFIRGAGIGPARVGLRMLAAKNSRKRMPARSPAAAARSVAEVIETSWFMRDPAWF